MKIGIFDSGLGGLWVLKHVRELMPYYNYVFFGDQAHVPYGNKSVDELFKFATHALTYLYEKENCGVVLLACNTTSSTIYEDLKVWVMEHYPGRFVFGIVRPTVEYIESGSVESLALFGTNRTVESHTYSKFLITIPDVYEVPLQELASLIETGGDTASYVLGFRDSIPQSVNTGALVCTHYGIVREDFKKAFPNIKKWVYQEDLIPSYLQQYFSDHEGIEERFFRGGTVKIVVSAPNPVFKKFLHLWFMEDFEIHVVNV